MAPVKDDDDEYGDQSRFYDDPPLVADEADPACEAEVFDYFRHANITPESLIDKPMAKRYAKWLKTAPPE
jgi:hypothetical protein